MKNLNLKTKENNMKGITLVALIITVIVLLILATVSINLVINNGLLDKAKYAVDKYSEGEITEQIKLAYQEWQLAQLTGTTESANDCIKNRLNSTIGNIEDVSVNNGKIIVILNKNGQEYAYKYDIDLGTINKSYKDYVGYYADIDADGTVDGVIFVDLLAGSVRDKQQWNNSDGTYTLPNNVNSENVNTYNISQESYTWAGITKPVILPKTTNGKQRFYVMQLNNFTVPANSDTNNTSSNYTSFYWYKNAKGKMNPLITSNDFGEGKENTRKILQKWNDAKTLNGYDAEQDNQDIWKHIQAKYTEGWFIPSRAEWAAFANEIGQNNPITISNYNSTYGFNYLYWSSSQLNEYGSWCVNFGDFCSMANYFVNGTCRIRFATTF